MKRLREIATIFFIAILMLSGCQTGGKMAGGLAAGKDAQSSPVAVDSIPARIYITDPALMVNPYAIELKGGYRLEYRVYTEAGLQDTLQTMLLMRDRVEIMDLHGGSSYGFPYKNIGYLGADFDSSFAFVQSFGSGNPHELHLIRKATGQVLLSGTWVAADEDEQVIVYIENEFEETEQLIIFDIRSNTRIQVAGIESLRCGQRYTGGLRDCVMIAKVTANEVILSFYAEGGTVYRQILR
jgi:hypothetical protein